MCCAMLSGNAGPKSRQTTMWANAQRDVMVALPNLGAALCSTPQILADAHY